MKLFRFVFDKDVSNTVTLEAMDTAEKNEDMHGAVRANRSFKHLKNREHPYTQKALMSKNTHWGFLRRLNCFIIMALVYNLFLKRYFYNLHLHHFISGFCKKAEESADRWIL